MALAHPPERDGAHAEPFSEGLGPMELIEVGSRWERSACDDNHMPASVCERAVAALETLVGHE